MLPLLFLTLLLMPVVFGKDYFTAAVFEHQTRGRNDPYKTSKDAIERNLKFYKKAAEIAVENVVDIIVFNEYGLVDDDDTGSRKNIRKYAESIPDPKKEMFINPCIEKHDDQYILSTLSCLARNNSLYVVANMFDIEECEMFCHNKDVPGCKSDCPDDGVLIYNTDVAFDREGYLVARYHKLHPYFEFVDTPEPEFITFDTDFGRFGLIVCFDLLFEESVKLVRNHNVDTLLFPTYWFDDITSLKAVEIQQAWALTHNVNLLAANTQCAKFGSLGSGIYSKHDGSLIYTYENDGDSKLLITNVKIKENQNIPPNSLIIVIREDKTFPKVEETGGKFPRYCYEDFVGPAKDVNDYRCFKSRTENFSLAKLEKPSGEVESCNNGFCCKLKYSSENLTDDFYLAALNNTNNVRNFYFWWEETCLLLRCDPYNGKDCMMEPSFSNTVFTHLEMKAKFEASSIYPTVTKNHFRLAPKNEWVVEHNTHSETVLKFRSDSKCPLLTFGLMGRDYNRDPPFMPWHYNKV